MIFDVGTLPIHAVQQSGASVSLADYKIAPKTSRQLTLRPLIHFREETNCALMLDPEWPYTQGDKSFVRSRTTVKEFDFFRKNRCNRLHNSPTMQTRPLMAESQNERDGAIAADLKASRLTRATVAALHRSATWRCNSRRWNITAFVVLHCWSLEPLVFLLALQLFSVSAFGQGSLTPPAGPSPGMKSLDQIEPRVDLQHAPPLAVTSDASNDFIISQPGSYYLTASIVATKANAVQINAPGVTLDLNGFQISKGSGSGTIGIAIAASSHGAVVRNGFITGFNYGVFSLITSDVAHGCVFRDLDISGCTRYGVAGGFGAVIESCRAHDNGPFTGTGVSAGIYSGAGSVISNCTAYNNSLGYAIFADAGCTLISCAASKNTASYGIAATKGSSLLNCAAYNNVAIGGIATDPDCSLTNCTSLSNTSSNSVSYGIYGDDRCTIVGCTANANTNTNSSGSGTTGGGIYAGSDSTVKNCTASTNKGDGIQVLQRTRISDCTATKNGSGTVGSGIVTDIRAVVRHCGASDNQKSGIVVLGGSSVLENTADNNGVGGPAAGIDSSGGFGSRIEANHARDNNGSGILTSNFLPFDIVIRNSAGGSATAYNPAGGPGFPNFGPIQPPSAATNPMANVQF